MARKPLLITAAIVTLVGVGVISGAVLAGITLVPATLIGFLSAGLTLSGLHIIENKKQNNALKTAMEELQSQFVYLHERQGQAETRVQDLVKRTIDQPSLALHATATDIDVLGSLVRDLAKTVADHEGRLVEQDKPLKINHSPVAAKPINIPAAATSSLRIAVPQNFEPDAELGFTADFPANFQTPQPEPLQPATAVMSELRETLAKAISDNRLELSLQPIVVLPQRKARGYEATMSLKGIKLSEQNGLDLPKVANATGLRVDLDKALLGRAVHVSRVLRTRQREIAMCCTVSIESLIDRDFRSKLEDIVRNDEKLARSILLEVDDTDLKASGVEGKACLFSISQLGIGIGISLKENLRFHAPDLVALGVRQLRVSAALMQSAAQGSVAADIHPADVAELLQRNGIDLLVSEITDEDTVRDMLDYAAQYAQGNLFGTARVVRPEVLEPKTIVANNQAKETPRSGVPQSGAQRTAAAAGNAPRNIPRQTFRSLLRKA
jgi:cyclic-di-GMP phosphodiesterase, flagellum assembly factor TipF